MSTSPRPMGNLVTSLLTHSRDTDSDVDNSFVVLSLGKADYLPVESINRARIHHRLMNDNERLWPYFNIFQLYSPDRDITEKLVRTALHNQDNSSKGRGVCDSKLIFTPCNADDTLCVIKLGRTRAVAEVQYRLAPISTLQELDLIEQALPLSNLFKVKLAANVTLSTLSQRSTKDSKTTYFTRYSMEKKRMRLSKELYQPLQSNFLSLMNHHSTSPCKWRMRLLAALASSNLLPTD